MHFARPVGAWSTCGRPPGFALPLAIASPIVFSSSSRSGTVALVAREPFFELRRQLLGGAREVMPLHGRVGELARDLGRRAAARLCRSPSCTSGSSPVPTSLPRCGSPWRDPDHTEVLSYGRARVDRCACARSAVPRDRVARRSARRGFPRQPRREPRRGRQAPRGARAGDAGRRRQVQRAPRRGRQAPAARAHRAPARPRFVLPRIVPARRQGRPGPRAGRRARRRHRARRGRRVPDHRERIDRQGRRGQRDDRVEIGAAERHRRAQPARLDLDDRIGRRRSAESIEDLRARRPRLSRSHASQRAEDPDGVPRVRQLDGRRRVHPGHERLHRDASTSRRRSTSRARRS